jgi:hypothetical protein
VRLDIPALEIEDACVSIIGALGENLGLLIFPSLEGFECFLKAADGDPAAPIVPRTAVLDLPPSMRREAVKHGWPVAGPDAYPRVMHTYPDGVPRPLSERDVRIASSSAAAVAAFFRKHRSIFQRAPIPPTCDSLWTDDDIEVRLTVPYEASHLFEVNDPRTPEGAAAPSATPRIPAAVAVPPPARGR